MADMLEPDPQAIIVRDWRHKLQHTFLTKTLPTPEAMPEMDNLFSILENHEMTIEQLQFSKISNVMRHITAVPQNKLPRDDEFKFRIRAKSLVEKWLEILNTNKPGAELPVESTDRLNGKLEDEVTRGMPVNNLGLNI